MRNNANAMQCKTRASLKSVESGGVEGKVISWVLHRVVQKVVIGKEGDKMQMGIALARVVQKVG